ncbi:mechanosensitive ion channel family protein [Synechococcus sp. CCY 9618]|uniref:mechanosensitive ion channel family protein n=1 Tax=Synechococcus sp. CCY 9618 TaxID=2815602 RepID=UPI001C215501|nr:mechanosensitive ion channel family protein [Synechococcus sp. CCY 9618]
MTTLGVTFLSAAIRVLGGSAVIWMATRVVRRLLRRLSARTATSTDDTLIRLVLGTLAPLGYLAMVLWGWQTLVRDIDGLQFDQGPDRFVSAAVELVAIVLVVRLVNRALLLLVNRSMQRLGREEQLSTLDGLAPMIGTILWIVGALVFLQNQGVELGAVYASLAGAGIGIGLALRGPFTNFINYLTILLDEPFQIGDFIRFGDVLGPVEQVGLRSSIIRSLSGERIVISNEELLNQTIHNFSDLPRRRVAHTIGVLYETPVEKVAAIPELVAQVVQAHPPAEFDRCHFTGFADSALDFEFVFFVPDGDIVLFLDLQQQINLGILRSFEDQEIGFAYPTQTLYLEQGQPAEA